MNKVRPFRSKSARAIAAGALAVGVIGGLALPRIAAIAAPNPTATVGNASVTEGDSGTTPADVTFSLSEASPNTTKVTYTTVDGTASKDTDYVEQTGTVTFNPGETTKHVAFSVRNDTVKESTETFTVKITAVDNNFGGVNNTGTVTITDNDLPPGLSVDSPSVTEGSTNGTVDLKFTARLSAPAGSATTYYAFTHDPAHDTDPNTAGTQLLTKADSGVDYTAKAGEAVTFGVGATSAEVVVKVAADLVDEPDEYFELQLKATNDANAAIAAYGNGKIVDDDAAARLDVSDPTPVNEGDTACGGLAQPSCTTKITFTVTLSPASGKRVVVDYATSDRSATSSGNSADYIAASGAGDPSATPTPGTGLVFAPGETSKTVDVFIKGDTTPEPTERFALTLSNAVNAALGDAEAFGTIVNDDPGTFATMSVSNAANVTEGNSGSPTATFTISVNRTGPSDLNTYTVTYTTANGPESSSSSCGIATSGKDYTAKTGTATIQALSNSTTVTVNVLPDTLDEPDECFQLQLNDAPNASITDAVGEAKIVDDDAAPSLAIAAKTVTEGTSSNNTTASLTVTLSPASGQVVTVDCSTVANSGTATQDADYGETVNQTITFQPGDTSKTCDIPVVADSLDEDNETVNVALSNPTGNANVGTGTATLTITDDDNAPTVSIANATDTEGTVADTTAPFVVTLSAKSSKPITVHVATADDTAKQPGDYTSTATDLTFAPGEDKKDFKVPVKADAIDEDDETFTATLTAPTNATLGTSSGTATIIDDDAAPTLSISDPEVTEGDSGTTPISFTVTRTGATEKTMTVHYATDTTGTATSTTDYTPTNGDLSFAPGDTSKVIVVQVKGDTTVEPNETFNVVLSAPTNATLSKATGTGTINDNDATPTTTSTSTTTPGSTTTTSTTIPTGPLARITTGAGAGGGPHIRVLKADGSAGGPSFFDGDETSGKHVARGDLNGDGRDEIITGGGTNSSGYVSVYSPDGALIASVQPYGSTFRGGVYVAAGDVDNDGQDEVITGAGPGGGPHVRTFTLNGNSLQGSAGFYAFADNFGGGVTVGAADLNGDGGDEILTGMASQGNNVRSFNYTGSGTALKGADFNPYATFTGGAFVAGGDLDGDGDAEIVTSTGPGGGGDPHLRTFAANGSPLGAGVYAYNVGFRGGFSLAVGDLTGDGKAEIITGAGPTGGPHVKIWSGGTNGVPQQQGPGFFAYPSNFNGGVWVAFGVS